MACPDSERVAQLLEGPCAPEEEQWLESHFAACAECQRALESSLEALRRSTAAVHEVTLPLGLWQKLCDSPPRDGRTPAPGLVEDVRLGPPRVRDALGSLGPYDVFRELGHGGFGVVYLARDPQVNRDFAVKVLWPKLAEDDRYLAEFYEEARRSNEVKSPYLVSVIRVGQPPEFQLPCLVMEYVEGSSLRQVVQEQTSEQRRVSCRRWAAVVQHVAEGLHALHEKGLLHRDVKAANILLDEQTGCPKLSDFGLAVNVARQDMPFLEDRAGTLPYMGPELVRSGKSDRRKRPDRRSDVYSLGIVLYECLAGERPFRADTPEALRQQILHDAPIPPRKRNAAAPRDLETITLKCLAKEPAERYATAEALALDLGRFQAGEPIHARPVGRTERAWRWCRRKPLVAGLIALSLLFAMSIMVVAPMWAVREGRLRQQAQLESQRAREATARAVASEQEAKRNLAVVYFQAARLAGERGRWRLALKNLDAAMDAGHPDPVRVSLERLRALEVLENVVSWGREVDALAARKDLGRYESQVRLWQGIRLQSVGEEAKGLELVRLAIEMGLPDAEAELARALIADTSPEAVDHLTRSLQTDPFCHQSMVRLTVMLLSLGRRDEVRQSAMAGRLIFQQDYTFPLVLACMAAFEGDSAATQTWLDETSRLCDASTAEMARNVVDLLGRARQYRITAENGTVAASYKDLFALWQSGLRLLQRRATTDVAGKANPTAHRPVAGIFVFIPRPVKEAVRTLIAALTPDLSTLFQRDHKRQIDALTKVAAVHPEGLILFGRAAYLMLDKRFQEAEEGFLKAAETPSIWTACHRDAWLAATAAAIERYFAPGGKREDIERAGRHLRRYADMGPITPEIAAMWFPTAYLAGDWELGRRLVIEGLRQRPDDPKLLLWKGKLGLATRDYVSAVEAADAMLRRDPNEPSALNVKQTALRKLREYLQQMESGDAAPKASKEAERPAESRGSLPGPAPGAATQPTQEAAKPQ